MLQKTTSEPLIEVPARTPAGERARGLRLSGHVPVLDGLRGLAIALVLLRHFTPGGEAHSTIGTIVKTVASLGNTGVDLFFVLSGFLITGILADAKGSAHYFRNFYARRTLRIFPLYYGVLVACFLIVPMIHPFGLAEQAVAHRQGWLWLYGTNIRESFSNANFPFSGGWIFMDHFWSLAVEEHFYLVWPLVIWMCSRRGAIAACFLFIATAFAWRLGLHLRHVESMAYYQLTTCRMDALALGGLLALLARESSDIRWATRAAWIAMPISFVALLLVRRTDWQEELFGGSLLAILFAALLVIVLTSRETNPVVRVLNARGLRLMGKYSYATYVLHPFLFATLMAWLSYQKLKIWTHSGLIGVCLYLVIGFTCSIALGWLSWHLYEKHFLKLKRFFEYRKPA
jgi:peptidoglycan/LPS O-acetylase OafA/YrhL